MIDAIYLIRYTALAQARLKAKCWIVDEQGVSRILKIITSVARVWAAFRESSYEVGPACGGCTRSTTKNAYLQVK